MIRYVSALAITSQDAKGRAVFVTGLPYPPVAGKRSLTSSVDSTYGHNNRIADPRVALKRRYLDDRLRASAIASRSTAAALSATAPGTASSVVAASTTALAPSLALPHSPAASTDSMTAVNTGDWSCAQIVTRSVRGFHAGPALTGQVWYTQQAFRAVNQVSYA